MITVISLNKLKFSVRNNFDNFMLREAMSRLFTKTNFPFCLLQSKLVQHERVEGALNKKARLAAAGEL